MQNTRWNKALLSGLIKGEWWWILIIPRPNFLGGMGGGVTFDSHDGISCSNIPNM